MSIRAGKRHPFSDHLYELRARLLALLAFLLLGTVAGYTIHGQLLQILVRPLQQPIFYSSPAGGLDLVFKLSFLFGFIVSVPLLIFQVLRFIEPALPDKSARKPLMVVLSSFCLLMIGICFGYFVSLPAALYFLNAFTPVTIQPLISTDAYFSFAARYLLGFGLLFQLPLILWLINSVERIPLNRLMAYQKWVIVISFVVAALLTPTPDVFNQLVMAVPLILLYQLSLVLLWVINRGKAR